MHAWLCENPVGVDALTWKELPTPTPGPGQVLIEIRAASLNFPDLLIVQNKYQMNEKELVILVTPHLVKPIARDTDLTPYLPGGAEQRDGPVWRAHLLGPASGTAVPGFSR